MQAKELAEQAKEKAEQELAITLHLHTEMDAIDKKLLDMEGLNETLKERLCGKTNALNALFKGYSPVNDQSNLESSLSKSAYRVDLSGVDIEEWDDLESSVYAYWTDPRRLTSIRSRGVIDYNKVLLSEDRQVTKELTLQEALNHVFEVVSRINGPDVKMAYGSESPNEQCLPADGICWVRNIATLAMELKCQRIVGQIKDPAQWNIVIPSLRYHVDSPENKKHVCNMSDSLLQIIKSLGVGILDCTQQLIGYSQALGVMVCCITIVNLNWPIMWTGQKLRISPRGWRIDACGPMSINCLFSYLIHLGLTTRATRPLPLPYLNGASGGFGEKPVKLAKDSSSNDKQGSQKTSEDKDGEGNDPDGNGSSGVGGSSSGGCGGGGGGNGGGSGSGGGGGGGGGCGGGGSSGKSCGGSSRVTRSQGGAGNSRGTASKGLGGAGKRAAGIPIPLSSYYDKENQNPVALQNAIKSTQTAGKLCAPCAHVHKMLMSARRCKVRLLRVSRTRTDCLHSTRPCLDGSHNSFLRFGQASWRQGRQDSVDGKTRRLRKDRDDQGL